MIQMAIIDEYIDYMGGVRRRSPRTLELYRKAVESFVNWAFTGKRRLEGREALEDIPDMNRLLHDELTLSRLRSWRHYLLVEQKLSSRTVNQHLSAVSGFCRYLLHRGLLTENPFDILDHSGKTAIESVKLRSEDEKRVSFFSDEALRSYFEQTKAYADGTILSLYSGDARPERKRLREVYDAITRRMIISFLYGTAVRRAELISLRLGDIDFYRGMLKVFGKGRKTREIAISEVTASELRNYLKTVEVMVSGGPRPLSDTIFVTFSGGPLYPVYVDRAVKTELGGREGFKGHKSPHVLRHSLATELLTEGADIYSVGRFLGHSSIAATQIYTHGDINQLKKVYAEAFPRANKE